MHFSVRATQPADEFSDCGIEICSEGIASYELYTAIDMVRDAVDKFYGYEVEPVVDVNAVETEQAIDHEPPYVSETQGHFDPSNEVDACCASCPDTDACNAEASPRNEFLLYTQYVEGSTRVAIWDPANPEETVVIGYVLLNEDHQ